MTCNDALNEYIKYRRSEMYSEHTISNDLITIKKFISTFKFENVAEIDAGSVKDYSAILKSQTVAGTSSNVYMNRIKKFLEFLYDFGIIGTDISAEVIPLSGKRARMQKGRRQYQYGRIMTREEKDLIINSAKVIYRGKINYQLMIELLMFSGLRIRELLNLKLKNIGLAKGMIILGKRRKFYLGNKRLINRIRAYCLDNNIINPDDIVFPNEAGNVIIYEDFLMVLKRVLEGCGLEFGKRKGGFTPHDFRMSLALSMNDDDMSFDDMKRILGYTDFQMLEKYIRHK